MKCLATQFVGYCHPRGIESSPGLQVVVVDVPEERTEAIMACAASGVIYAKPLVPDPPAPAESEPELALEPPPPPSPARPAYQRRLIPGKGYAGGRVRRTAP